MELIMKMGRSFENDYLTLLSEPVQASLINFPCFTESPKKHINKTDKCERPADVRRESL